MKFVCERRSPRRSSGTRPTLLVLLLLMIPLGVGLGLCLSQRQRDQCPTEFLNVWRIPPDCTHANTTICCTRALFIAAHFYPPFKLVLFVLHVCSRALSS